MVSCGGWDVGWINFAISCGRPFWQMLHVGRSQWRRSIVCECDLAANHESNRPHIDRLEFLRYALRMFFLSAHTQRIHVNCPTFAAFRTFLRFFFRCPEATYYNWHIDGRTISHIKYICSVNGHHVRRQCIELNCRWGRSQRHTELTYDGNMKLIGYSEPWCAFAVIHCRRHCLSLVHKLH